jgi:hypothetical protein
MGYIARKMAEKFVNERQHSCDLEEGVKKQGPTPLEKRN